MGPPRVSVRPVTGLPRAHDDQARGRCPTSSPAPMRQEEPRLRRRPRRADRQVGEVPRRSSAGARPARRDGALTAWTSRRPRRRPRRRTTTGRSRRSGRSSPGRREAARNASELGRRGCTCAGAWNPVTSAAATPRPRTPRKAPETGRCVRGGRGPSRAVDESEGNTGGISEDSAADPAKCPRPVRRACRTFRCVESIDWKVPPSADQAAPAT